MLKKYRVCAYLCTNFSGLMNSLGTDDWEKVKGFVWENANLGYNCEITNNYTGARKQILADVLLKRV